MCNRVFTTFIPRGLRPKPVSQNLLILGSRWPNYLILFGNWVLIGPQKRTPIRSRLKHITSKKPKATHILIAIIITKSGSGKPRDIKFGPYVLIRPPKSNKKTYKSLISNGSEAKNYLLLKKLHLISELQLYSTKE